MKSDGVLQDAVPGGRVDVLRPSVLSYRLDQIIRVALGVYIFSLPFSGLLLIERNGFIFLIVLMTIWCAVNRRHFFCRTPVDFPLAVFVLWVGVSVPFSASPVYSFWEFAKLIQQGLVFYWVVFFFQASRYKLRILVMFLGVLIASSLYGIWQFDSAPIRKYYFIVSFLGSEVSLTTFLIMSLPLSAAVAVYGHEPWLRKFGASAAPLAVACQLLTFSRAGMLALFVEAIVMAGMVRTRLVTLLAGAVLVVSLSGAGALLYIGDQSKLSFIPVKTKLSAYNLVSRFEAWELGLEKVAEYPFFGMGYGKNMFQQVAQSQLDHSAEVPMAGGTHNTLLDITVGAGVPAGLAFLWLMWTIGRTGFVQFFAPQDPMEKIWSFALFLMVSGLFVRIFFDHMWIGNLALIFWVMVGMAVRPVLSRV
jgi:O-antigen ligase